jgi:pyruvate, water dikinase
MDVNKHFTKWFDEIEKNDTPLVGVKGVNLGEMYSQGFPVPNGFVITPAAYYHFLKVNKLDVKIKHVLSTANVNHLKSLHQISEIIGKLINDAPLPNDLITEIVNGYKKLGESLVSIKHSPASNISTVEKFTDTPNAMLNVKGDVVLLLKIKQAWAQMFNPREIFIRHEQRIDHTQQEMSLIVQQMVESERSGVLFTADPKNNDKNKIIIKAILGLGESIPLGDENPDIYEVNKSDFVITKKYISHQNTQLIKTDTVNKQVNVSSNLAGKQKISDQQITNLAKLGDQIEKFYYFPQKVEWALQNNNFYIIQSLPITPIVHEENEKSADLYNDLILKGLPVNKGIASGPVKILLSKEDAEKVTSDDIVVIKEIKSFFLNCFKKASAVIIEDFDKNIQIIFESNELKLPCISNATNATKILQNDAIVTVNGSKGEVYKGGISIHPNKFKLQDPNKKTATKLFVNLGTTEELPEEIQNKVDGALILNTNNIVESLGVHPKKLIKEKNEKTLIDSFNNYIVKFCKILPEKPVIYQFTSLTTADYRNLEGGADFEGTEENPGIGFRGAFRFIHDPQTFGLELAAIKRARDEMNFNNLWVTIPYVRTTEELTLVKKMINRAGLERSNDFKIFMTIELPSNIIELDKFIELGLDGFLINYSSLTSLLTGTDKNNAEINAEINKYDVSLAWILEKIIKTANDLTVPVMLFNENAEISQELITNLIPQGISGICVTPQAVDQTKKSLLQAEKTFVNK